MVGMGSHCGTLKVAVDALRAQGVSAGVARLRMFRPFPRARLAALMRGRKAVGVLDRSVCFGWGSGHLFVDVKAAAADLGGAIPMVNFIGGLAGTDLRREMLERAVRATAARARGDQGPEVVWLNLE
jgi:pyruvate/2-oxoacid:ferredoxin oxidoreductase alpha subunit